MLDEDEESEHSNQIVLQSELRDFNVEDDGENSDMPVDAFAHGDGGRAYDISGEEWNGCSPDIKLRSVVKSTR